MAYGGSFILALSNNNILNGSQSNDLMIYTGNSNQKILFGCSNNSNIFGTFNSNGFLGIGKSNPNYSMDIQGDLNFSGTLRQSGNPYIGSQWSNNSSNIFILGSNVGIGTNNPQYQLDLLFSTLRVQNGNYYLQGNDGTFQIYDSSSTLRAGLMAVTGAFGYDSNWLNANDVCLKSFTGKMVIVAPNNIILHDCATNFFVNGTTLNAVLSSNLGIGIENPQYNLDLSSGTIGSSVGQPIIIHTSTYNNGLPGSFQASGYVFWGNQFEPLIDNYIYLGQGNNRFTALYATNGTIQTSDETDKDYVPLEYGLNDIMQITPIKYKWKSQSNLPDSDPTKNYEYYGLCARELDKIFPELVYNETDTYHLNYTELIPVLVNAIKDLSQKCDEKQKKIDYLNNFLKSKFQDF